MAIEKWGDAKLSHEVRVAKFVKRTVDDFMVKELNVANVFSAVNEDDTDKKMETD